LFGKWSELREALEQPGFELPPLVWTRNVVAALPASVRTGLGSLLDRLCHRRPDRRPRAVEALAALAAIFDAAGLASDNALNINGSPLFHWLTHGSTVRLQRPLFHGRAEFRERLLACLTAEPSPSRPLVVLGPPGAGKSRLLREVHEIMQQRGRFVPVLAGTSPKQFDFQFDMVVQTIGNPNRLLIDDADIFEAPFAESLAVVAQKGMFSVLAAVALPADVQETLRGEELILPAFSGEELRSFLEKILDETVAEETLARFEAVVGGYPGEVIETLEWAGEQLPIADAGSVLADILDRLELSDDVPPALEASSRICRRGASPEKVRLLDILACHGVPVRAEELEGVWRELGEASPAVGSDPLWLREDERGLCWRTRLLARAFRRDIPVERRLAIHRAFLAVSPSAGAWPPEARARHHAGTDDFRGAAAAWKQAGDEARQSGDLSGAARDYRRAALVAEQLGEDAAGVELRLTLELNLGGIAYLRRDFERAVAAFTACLEAAGRRDLPLPAARARQNLGNVAWLQGRTAEAAEHFAEAGVWYERAKAPDGVAQVTLSLGNLALARGERTGARETYERAWAWYRDHPEAPGYAAALSNLAVLELLAGRHESAREHFLLLTERREQEGDRIGLALSRANAALACCYGGDWASAVTLAEAAWTASLGAGEANHQAEIARIYLTACLAAGRWERLTETTEHLERLSEDELSTAGQSAVYLARGELHLATGAYAEAARAFREARLVAEKHALPETEAEAAYGEAAALLANPARSSEATAEVRALARRLTTVAETSASPLAQAVAHLLQLRSKEDEESVTEGEQPTFHAFLAGEHALVRFRVLLRRLAQEYHAITDWSGADGEATRQRLLEVHEELRAFGERTEERLTMLQRLQLLPPRLWLLRRAGREEEAALIGEELRGGLARLSLALPEGPVRRMFLAQALPLAVWGWIEEISPPSQEKAAPPPVLLRERARLEELVAVSRALHSAPTRQDFFRQVLEQAVAFTGAERGLVGLSMPGGGLEIIQQYSTLATNAEQADDWSVSRSVIADVHRSGTPVQLHDTMSEEDYRGRRSILAGALRTIMCVPLRVSGDGSEPPRVVGVLYVDSRRERKTFTPAELLLFEVLANLAGVALENARLRETLEAENRSLRRQVQERYHFGSLIGRSRPMQQVYDLLERAAASDANVLITGESGTGKELAARVLHYTGARRERPFVGVNCAALPETLLERELFGIEKGVATGVERGIGLFEQAQGGTLFLDEVGDMSLAVQAKILRVLQERAIRRIGGLVTIPVDLRLVCASNQDLRVLVREGQFREDLLYRIEVIVVRLPPLRERREDIPLLAETFLERFARRDRQTCRGFTPDARDALVAYAWPGNVRELENEVDRAVSLAPEATVLGVEALSEKVNSAFREPRRGSGSRRLAEVAEEAEVRAINEALRETSGNKTRAARLLGISREALRQKVLKYGNRLVRGGPDT
jgi:Nif-specific regulatory protein